RDPQDKEPDMKGFEHRERTDRRPASFERVKIRAPGHAAHADEDCESRRDDNSERLERGHERRRNEEEARALTDSGGGDQRHEARSPPRRNAFGGGKYSGLAIKERQACQRRCAEQPRALEPSRRKSLREQQNRRPRLARHPRLLRLQQYINEAPWPSDLQPNEEQSSRN